MAPVSTACGQGHKRKQCLNQEHTGESLRPKHSWKCTSEFYTRPFPFHISKSARASVVTTAYSHSKIFRVNWK